MRITLLSILAFVIPNLQVQAQHEHHNMPTDTTARQQAADSSSLMADMQASLVSPPMTHAYSLNLPMTRNGSGTGWLPDASPMYGYMFHSRKWMYMVHGNIFIRYNKQDVGNKGTRGASKVDAPNWFMAMGQRRVGGNGLFHFNSMFSLDPLFGGDGYPLLFQTGETFEGKPLVDRQHPHNLFSELSVSYSQEVTKDIDGFVYLGYPGEPALGPVAFMHRPSSLNNLDSPLGHHWQDATHITFGVATIGFRYKILKMDASLFNGREPGEGRYGFDKLRLNSYSYRLTVNPTQSLSAQVSKAFIKSPEALEPEENIHRTTASIQHSVALRKDGFLTSSVVWGFNDSGDHHQEHSITAESNIQINRFAAYGRFENIEKSAQELQLNDFNDHQLFRISAVTLGTNYTIVRQWNTNFSVGAQATHYSADHQLNTVYGKNPFSIEVYMRVSPQLMTMGRMKM